MAKQLKFNIKNAQLAALLGKKKEPTKKQADDVKPKEDTPKKTSVRAKKITSLFDEKAKQEKIDKEKKEFDATSTQEALPVDGVPELNEAPEQVATEKTEGEAPKTELEDVLKETLLKKDAEALEERQNSKISTTSSQETNQPSFLVRRGPLLDAGNKQSESEEPKPSAKKVEEKKDVKAATTNSSETYSTPLPKDQTNLFAEKKTPPKKKLKEIESEQLSIQEAEELRAIDTSVVKRPTFSRTVCMHNKAFEERKNEGFRRRSFSRTRKIRRPNTTIYPTNITIRLPITIKDLANELKRKANELIQPLFLEGFTFTQNDVLDDEAVTDFLQNKFACRITIDRSKNEFIQVTDKTVEQEISETQEKSLELRAPIVAFMGHVDHGKTSLIDSIRKTDMVKGEAGSITQHIGAFRASTSQGPITILDTPGHEAFSNIRSRGAKITDICVLVIAGDEGIKPQTREAIDKTKEADVPVIVAINKCDKPGFNADEIYRQLADVELLPEAWGGQTITINCSAKTGEGVENLLELLALQAEVLELKADPTQRARGYTLESNIVRGYGVSATILIQNGTLNLGDALVFNHQYGKIKTMENEHGQKLKHAQPSFAVKVTGLSDAPEAGDEFIVVENEKTAKDIVESRLMISTAKNIKNTGPTDIDELFKDKKNIKTLNVVIKADTKSSLEALISTLIETSNKKVEIKITHSGIGAITENDILMAKAIDASIYAFHTTIDPRGQTASEKEQIQCNAFDVIYHLIDAIKIEMTELLDPIEERIFTGAAEVLVTFKASGVGVIAGCKIVEGSVKANTIIKLLRGKDEIIETKIQSLKHLKDEVKEVKKGFECGIVLSGFKNFEIGDRLESYKIEYKKQTLDS